MNNGWPPLKFSALLVLGSLFSLSACAGLFGPSGTTWKEEALLHDSSKIAVIRAVERGGRHEIGQKPAYTEQSLTFTLPGTGERITWEDHYSKDLGGANFLPMLIDVLGDTVYLVVSPMGCLAYNKWGRPNPPYVVFKYRGRQWARISLEDLPAEIKTPNLILSMPDLEVKRLGMNLVPAETIRQIIDEYRQPQYRSILRERIADSQLCPPERTGFKAP